MIIKDLADLKKVIQSCRKLGVESIKVGDVEFHLGSLPEPVTSKRTKAPSNVASNDTITAVTPGGITEDTRILTEELTPDQLLFYSARPEDMTEGPQ